MWPAKVRSLNGLLMKKSFLATGIASFSIWEVKDMDENYGAFNHRLRAAPENSLVLQIKCTVTVIPNQMPVVFTILCCPLSIFTEASLRRWRSFLFVTTDGSSARAISALHRLGTQPNCRTTAIAPALWFVEPRRINGRH
jgi:hypothetical protein